MQLPAALHDAIEKELYDIPQKDLLAASADLTRRYRSDTVKNNYQNNYMSSHLHRMAYIAARMPATYAAVHAVLSEIKKRAPDAEIKSLLDLGAGPGTVFWAATQLFNLDQATLIEQDQDLIAIGKALLNENTDLKIDWIKYNLQQDITTNTHDLVTLSYAINELSDADKIKTARNAWNKTNQFIAIIEPGTKQGYRNILLVRDELIKLGSHVVAPCPHALTCSMIVRPLTPDDWCHFPARVERTSLHRRIKEGSLPYEDEKFSYIVMSKHPVALPFARIVRHPDIHKGHVDLTLCVTQEIKRVTAARRDKAQYQSAKKSGWGDSF